MASHSRVRLEGVCAQGPVVLRRARVVLEEGEGEVTREEEDLRLRELFGEGEVGEVGSGNSEGCLRVETMMLVCAECARPIWVNLRWEKTIGEGSKQKKRWKRRATELSFEVIWDPRSDPGVWYS